MCRVLPPKSEAALIKLRHLKDRARMLHSARSFFAERSIIEVDCPLLSRYPSIDAHIDLITATYNKTVPCYLHTSPEYGMKRLLASGIGDIYQLSHVFRDGEYGGWHNPEFMLAEWYRVGFTLNKLINETAAFCCLFLGSLPLRIVDYRTLLQSQAGVDCHKTPLAILQQRVSAQGMAEADTLDRDTCLQLILQAEVEPKLGFGELVVLTDYPASQAALACTKKVNGFAVAERFELYYHGVELANGYHELGNAEEQQLRLQEANKQRVKVGKEELNPIDERFLAALEKGLPDCCGVAVGFDRLMMLRCQTNSLLDILPFTWEDA